MNRYYSVSSKGNCTEESALKEAYEKLVADNPTQEENIFYVLNRMSGKPFAFIENIESCDDIKTFETELVIQMKVRMELK